MIQYHYSVAYGIIAADLYSIVFSPTTNEWTATAIINYDYIVKNNGIYTKLVLSRLSEFSREYQRTEIQSVTEDIMRQPLQEREREVCIK